MDNITGTFLAGGVLGVVLVVGITQGIKKQFGVQGRAAAVTAAVVSALVALMGALPEFFPWLREPIYYVVVAITLWLTSAGVYSVGATVAKGQKKDAAKV